MIFPSLSFSIFETFRLSMVPACTEKVKEYVKPRVYITTVLVESLSIFINNKDIICYLNNLQITCHLYLNDVTDFSFLDNNGKAAYITKHI